MSCSSPCPVPPKKRKWRPSGRNCGKRWLPWPDGSCVTGTGVPPVAITRIRTPKPSGANTMTSSLVPRATAASRRVRQLRARRRFPNRSASACRRQRTQSRGHPASRTDSGLPRCPRAAAPSPGRAAAPRAATCPRTSRRTPAAGRRPTARTIPDRSSAAWGSQSASEAAQVQRDGSTAWRELPAPQRSTSDSAATIHARRALRCARGCVATTMAVSSVAPLMSSSI